MPEIDQTEFLSILHYLSSLHRRTDIKSIEYHLAICIQEMVLVLDPDHKSRNKRLRAHAYSTSAEVPMPCFDVFSDWPPCFPCHERNANNLDATKFIFCFLVVCFFIFYFFVVFHGKVWTVGKSELRTFNWRSLRLRRLATAAWRHWKMWRKYEKMERSSGKVLGSSTVYAQFCWKSCDNMPRLERWDVHRFCITLGLPWIYRAQLPLKVLMAQSFTSLFHLCKTCKTQPCSSWPCFQPQSRPQWSTLPASFSAKSLYSWAHDVALSASVVHNAAWGKSKQPKAERNGRMEAASNLLQSALWQQSLINH